MKPRVLVAFYSRTGTTRRVAEALARELEADVEEISDSQRRGGPLGYLRSGLDAILGRMTPLHEAKREPADYDLVLIGTPVWMSSVSAPVRTYLTLNRGWIRRVAFFLTEGGMGSRRVLDQMAHLCGRKPAGELTLTERHMTRGEYLTKVQQFARELIGAPRQYPRPTGPLVVEEPAATPPHH